MKNPFKLPIFESRQPNESSANVRNLPARIIELEKENESLKHDIRVVLTQNAILKEQLNETHQIF